MSIEELEKRERDAYEAFMEADWMHADMRLNEWLDAAHELNEAKGAVIADWFGRHPIIGFGLFYTAYRAAEIFITTLLNEANRL